VWRRGITIHGRGVPSPSRVVVGSVWLHTMREFRQRELCLRTMGGGDCHLRLAGVCCLLIASIDGFGCIIVLQTRKESCQARS
jgi:hypothetical protein